MTISFWVSGDPKGQPRPRAFARKMGNTFVARVYDAGTAEGWKSQIAEAAKPHLTRFEGPVGLSLAFYFRRPQYHFSSNGKLKDNAPDFHTALPDSDNLAKAVSDCLTTIGMWPSDKNVARLEVVKRYVPILKTVGFGLPGAQIGIQSLDPAFDKPANIAEIRIEQV